MSKEIDIVNLSRIFEDCDIPYRIMNVRSPYGYVPGMSDSTDYEPVCDINLTFNSYTAKAVADDLIKLGETLKKEMAEE